jgi:hypothetical protein
MITHVRGHPMIIHVRGHPMIIHVQFGFNQVCSF